MMNKLPKIESDKLFNQLKKHKKDLKGKKLINLSNCETNLKKGKWIKINFSIMNRKE